MILVTREPNLWVRPEGVKSRKVEGRVLIDQNNCKQSIQVELYRFWHGEIRGGRWATRTSLWYEAQNWE